ncbi:MAG: acyltransferase [Planctomycetota bacterium]
MTAAHPAIAEPAPQAPPRCEGRSVLTLSRLAAALMRRLRLRLARLAHPGSRFGDGCDVRRGLALHRVGNGRIAFGQRCVLDRGLTVEAEGELTIGDRVVFGHHCTIASKQRLVIGDDTLIAEMVSIRDHDHRFDNPSKPVREQGAACAPVSIGRDVWLGGKVTVLKGVTIGDHAIVGANAVVTRDLPPGAIAVGVPAKVVRYRQGFES